VSAEGRQFDPVPDRHLSSVKDGFSPAQMRWSAVFCSPADYYGYSRLTATGYAQYASK